LPARFVPLSAVLLLSAAGFTVLTTEFLIVGLLPAMARDLDVTVSQAGLLVTLFAFTVAASGPFLTALLNGVERKSLFVGTLVLIALSNTLAAFAPNIWVMAIARLVPAFVLPVFWSPASETAVDLIGPERAGKAISTVALGIVCATVFGIPIDALISDALGWRSAFGVLAIVAFGKALMLLTLFPAVRLKKQRISVMQQLRILRKPLMAGHVLLSVLVFTLFTAYTYLADMLERLADFDSIGVANLGFAAAAIVALSVMLALTLLSGRRRALA
jgi:DHA1 family inner membrane transport protein